MRNQYLHVPKNILRGAKYDVFSWSNFTKKIVFQSTCILQIINSNLYQGRFKLLSIIANTFHNIDIHCIKIFLNIYYLKEWYRNFKNLYSEFKIISQTIYRKLNSCNYIVIQYGWIKSYKTLISYEQSNYYSVLL